MDCERYRSWLHKAILLLLMIQPVVDLDYLFYPFLHAHGLPRLATVIRFLVLPLLIAVSFFLREQNKKKTVLLTGCWLLLSALYFYLHDRQSMIFAKTLDFTKNFTYSPWQELTYCLTLLVPVLMIDPIRREKFTMEEVRQVVCFESALISVSIVLGDLYVFAKSTYYGNTVGNLFSWFNGIYQWYHPRTLASKFFFHEGNTIGILLFMTLPLLYYFLTIETDHKKRVRLSILILLQSLAMQMLATRVATYGAVVMPLVFLAVYLFNFILHREKWNWRPVLTCILSAGIFALILPYTPAVENQHIDAINDTALLHNGAAAEGLGKLKEMEGKLIPGTPEYINFYVYMFEAYGINGRYIQSVPSMYYTTYYSYQHDPKFWVDVMNMDVYDRVNGRQIETIFTKYKYQNLSVWQKVLGMGYSTFNAGGIVLERDFVMQMYLLGYGGVILFVFPWLTWMIYGLVAFIRRFKKLMTLSNMILSVSLGAGMAAAYLSGHMLDQFITTMFCALAIGVLVNHIQESAHV